MKHRLFFLFLVCIPLAAEQLLECDYKEVHPASTLALQTARSYVDQEKYKEALPYFEQACKENPTDIQLLFEYANTLTTINHSSKALTIYQQLLHLRPRDSSILFNMAYTLKQMGRLDEALSYYQATLAKKPDHAEAHFSLALAYLLQGNFQKGWEEYEWRWKRNCPLAPHVFNQPLWDGSCLTGKTLFLHAEQGLGDTFQFIRYAKVIKEKYHGTIIVSVQKPLVDIISRCCPYIDRVIPLEQMPSSFDFHAPLLTLPYILKTDEHTIPAPIPYIIPDTKLIEHWHHRLATDTNIKVGICWQGNSNYSTPFLRTFVAAKSISLSAFAPLARVPGVSLYSLQKETGTDQITQIGDTFTLHTFDEHFDKDHGRFMDTAAVIKNLDLIITVDTSIVHLAGAVGDVPVWVLLPEPADWRWMLQRTDSPWYPQLRLFRQPTTGDWESLIATITQELYRFIAQKRHPDPVIMPPSTPLDAASYEAQLRHNPDDARVHHAYGMYLANLDQPSYYEKAYHHLKKATELQPINMRLFFEYGTFCTRIGKFHDALAAYRTILTQKPTTITALYNSAYTLKLADNSDLAIALYRKILAIQPDHQAAHLALAFALLNKGDFANGWQEHTWNLKKQGKNSEALRELLQHNTVAGKTILLLAEGGLGDTLQFIRYAQRLHDRGARIIVAAQQPLITLLSGCPFIHQLLPSKSTYPPYDAVATLMSLPALFADTQDSIPRTIPYIFPPKERIEYWQQQLANDPNIKIGICWQPDVHNDVSRLPIARRGIALEHFFALGSLPGVTLYSLQQKEGLDQLAHVPATVQLRLFDDQFDKDHGNFIDTAAVMHTLDLIITTDTAIAHLAGALGKPVWLLIPYAADWRWIAHRTDSPWYPTMRIFQQTEPFNWTPIMHQMIAACKKEILMQ